MVRTQPLAIRMCSDERVELGDEGAVAAGIEVGGDTCLEHGQPALLEARGLRLGERLVRDIRERGAAPERKRLRVGAVLDEPREAVDVELALARPRGGSRAAA